MSLQKDMRYTYSDYCDWNDKDRWELIEGVPYQMAPALSRRHQEISMELSVQLGAFLKGKPCQVFAAPFDVRLAADGADDTVCQPDLLVVCDASKLDENGCKGAPDLIIEIISPSTERHDRLTKLNLYQRMGVREYWMVDPKTNIVQVCVLKDGHYNIRGYECTDSVPVQVLEGCVIKLKDVFGEVE